MNFKSLCQTVVRQAAPGSEEWASRYIDLDQKVREAVTAHPGVVTDFHMRLGAPGGELLRVSLVLSDFTSLFLDSYGKQQILLAKGSGPEWPNKVTVPQALHEPGGILEKILMHDGEPVIRPGFRACADDGLARFGEELAPLAEAGRLLVRPHPVMVAHTTVTNDKGGTDLQMFDVDPNVPGDTWYFMDHRTQQSVPMKQDAPEEGREAQIATVLLPYLAGVPYADLARILDDEEHHLAEFRAAIKDLVKNATDKPGAAYEIIEDKVRPAVEKVERRFRSIAGMHSLRIGGTVLGTVAASLSALLLGPGVAVAATTLAGGTALLAREWGDLLKAKGEMKDMPFYLLWRLNRAQQS